MTGKNVYDANVRLIGKNMVSRKKSTSNLSNENIYDYLSDQQKSAIQGIIDKKFRIIMGSAGTGKSDIVVATKKILGDKCMVLTPTYKTKIALNEKGIEMVNLIEGLFKNTSIQDKIFSNDITHIIVDEAGMVERYSQVLIESFFSKLQSKKIHVTFIGDPDQLDPISNKHIKFNNSWFENEIPDLVLTRQYRQSSETIINVEKDFEISPDLTYICMTNRTRNEINHAAHRAKHKAKAYTSHARKILAIHKGDRLVCYKNRGGSLFNNCIYTVAEVIDDPVLNPDCYNVKLYGVRNTVEIRKSLFHINGYEKPSEEKREWELSYAITCHSAQGSGFDDVVVYIEASKKTDGSEYFYGIQDINIQKWLYTAITRGIKSVTIVDPTDAIGRENLSIKIDARASFD